MKTYGKLVRDRIPEIIIASGKLPIVRTLEPDEYRLALRAKLVEEAREVNEADDATLLSEFADVAEVLDAAVEACGFTPAALAAERGKRNAERGSFSKRILLDRVE